MINLLWSLLNGILGAWYWYHQNQPEEIAQENRVTDQIKEIVICIFYIISLFRIIDLFDNLVDQI